MITHDHCVAAAKAFSNLHPESPFVFVHVSGMGATQTPGMFTPLYGRVKGQAESALLEVSKTSPQFKVFNVRPAGVDWRHHPEIHPFIPQQAMYKKMLLPPIEVLRKSMSTPTKPMGRIFTELAMSKGEALSMEHGDVTMGGRTLDNLAIRRLAGLD